MKHNHKKKISDFNITRREYLIYLRGISALKWEDPWYGGGTGNPNKRGKYRSDNSNKSWKNYRKHQYRWPNDETGYT